MERVNIYAAAAAKSLQSCPTLCDTIDGSPPGSPVPGILQARTLEWVAISFSNAWKWKGKMKSLSRVRLLATPWIAAHQAPPSIGFSRQEYWSGVPLPSPNIYTTICKIDCQRELALWPRELNPGLCDHLEVWDQEGGDIHVPMGTCSTHREGTYTYLWLILEGGDIHVIHAAVWQKRTQYCKAIVLELKITFLI